MKRKNYTLFLLATLLPCVALAQPYPTESYQLSADKTMLVKWLGQETSLELDKDPAFNGVTTIGEEAFSTNRDIRQVVLPANCTAIAPKAFADCNSLERIVWSDKLSSIGDESFWACKALSEVDFKCVTSIGASAFSGCFKLSKVSLPKTLHTLGEYAFYNCRGLADFEVHEENETYFAIDGVLYSDLLGKWYLEQYPRAKASSEYVIPYPTLGVAARAFDNAKKLKRLYIPSEMSRFNSNAFFNCSGLEEIYIYRPFPPEVLGEDAFYGVDVANCKLYVPEEAIDQFKAADGWKLFTTILPIPQEEGISKMSYIYDHKRNVLLRYIGNEPVVDMRSDATLAKTEEITDEAFGAELANMTLRKLVLGPKVKHVGEAAIWATEVTDIVLNDGLEVLEEAAISGAKIERIELPATLKEFTPGAIYNAFYLKEISIRGENPRYSVRDGVLIETATNTLLSVPTARFAPFAKFPEGIRAIAPAALANNIKLSQITFGDGLEQVGDEALSYCFTLNYIDFPATLKALGQSALQRCTELQTVIIRASSPPTAYEEDTNSFFEKVGTFEGIGAEATLYVPKEAVDLYKEMPVYRDSFKSIKPLTEAPAPAPFDVELVSASSLRIATSKGFLKVEADQGYLDCFNINGQWLKRGVGELEYWGYSGETILIQHRHRDGCTTEIVLLP